MTPDELSASPRECNTPMNWRLLTDHDGRPGERLLDELARIASKHAEDVIGKRVLTTGRDEKPMPNTIQINVQG